jgi:hypothetical protein
VSAPAQAAIGTQADLQGSVSLRSIEDFLDTSPPAVPEYVQETRDESYESEVQEKDDELPPVEHFIDELPAVDYFAPDSGAGGPGNGAAGGGEPAETGWLETEWQHFDWRAAAALGETANEEASSAWATTDWGGTAPRVGNLRQTAAHAIATALDEIARRIRDGDLAVPGQGPMADPATIAATLAALLGVKR